MPRQLYALHDTDPKNNPMTRIQMSQAKDFNSRGYGIFWTVQSFEGPRRIENLERINAWAIDMDTGTKPQMIERIESGLVPTFIVETARGFHVYWKAKDALPENWGAIVTDRLVPYYQADPNARDLARILRVPGFLHQKDPANPFLVSKAWEWPVAYTELQIAQRYPSQADASRVQESKAAVMREAASLVGGNLWARVWALNCLDALERLSGHPAVGGEVYTFRRNGSGTYNILVNGSPTSTWIDRDSRIGSLSGGGPTIYNWLLWFRHAPRRAVEIILEVFPECGVAA